MTDTPTPDWNFLPQSPERFFCLNSGFESEELKRAYGAFVRQFKPDKFPNEFKKIRAAYEQLDRNLRYGRTQADANSPNSFLQFNEVIHGELETSGSTTLGGAHGKKDRVSLKEVVLQHHYRLPRIKTCGDKRTARRILLSDLK